jgi:adenylyltransferase/sulfurtransferase
VTIKTTSHVSSQGLDDNALLRYSRHIMLPQIDIQGQQQLFNKHALIIGLGGLGSPVSQYLAAAGVGKLTLMDDDTVELSNLQRQIVHSESSIGLSKVSSARQSLLRLNSNIEIVSIERRFNATDEALLADIDVVLDCSDNLATRYAINHACVQQKTPLIIGAAIQFEGQLTIVDANDEAAPCYACLHRGQPVSEIRCAEMGVFSPLLGVIGSMQAVEALKILLDLPVALGQLLLYDGLATQSVSGANQANQGTPNNPFDVIRYRRWLDCPSCAKP